MEIKLIRHADPNYEQDTITPVGHQQARMLAEKLENERIDKIFCSPLGRAQDTMRYTAEKKQMTHQTLDWLAELNGCFDGEHWAWNMSGPYNLRLESVPTMEDWHVDSDYGAHMLGLYTSLAQSFDGLLSELGYSREHQRYKIEEPTDDVIAVFCHEGLIKTLLGSLLHWPLPCVYSHIRISPSSVTNLLWKNNDGYAVPRVTALNDLSHLNH